jgi:hypothetical protein
VDGPEKVLTFNRYSPSLARTIWDRRLNIAATLNATNGFIDPADEFFFGGFTKLDFLWSLTRAK